MSEIARTYERPGPGTWTLDASHCARPRSRYTDEVFAATYTRGFRSGFERYGSMLDTIEYASVNGFVYTSVRPLGAPANAKGPPLGSCSSSCHGCTRRCASESVAPKWCWPSVRGERMWRGSTSAPRPRSSESFWRWAARGSSTRASTTCFNDSSKWIG